MRASFQRPGAVALLLAIASASDGERSARAEEASLREVLLVVEDRVSLRADAHDAAARQAMLWKGDWLEVRGERAGYLAVYDRRHERPGYVRPWQVRRVRLDEAGAPGLRALVEFLRDAPGQESLGIAAVALYLKAAPPSAIDAMPFDALGTMADRLARRASARRTATVEGALGDGGGLAAQLEVAASWGVRLVARDDESPAAATANGAIASASLPVAPGAIVTCYDGDAFRRVIAMPASATEKARAALGLTRPDCRRVERRPGQTLAQAERAGDEERLAVLAQVDVTGLPAWWAGRVRLREAEVAAQLAWSATREADAIVDGAGADEASRLRARAGEAERMAEHALALVDRTQLADEDASRYDETAIAVAAMRWAASDEPAAVDALAARSRRGHLPSVRLVAGADAGERCLEVRAPGAAESARPVARRCTHGHVWLPSLTIAARGEALAVAVQPLARWVELWVVRRGPVPPSSPSVAGPPRVDGQGAAEPWLVDTLLPAVTSPELGYVEAAGFSPDGARLLVVREARLRSAANGATSTVRRQFEELRTDSLTALHHAGTPDALVAFRRWQAPAWRAGTLALR